MWGDDAGGVVRRAPRPGPGGGGRRRARGIAVPCAFEWPVVTGHGRVGRLCPMTPTPTSRRPPERDRDEMLRRRLLGRRWLGLGGGAVVLGVVLGLAVLALYPTLDPDDAGRGLVLVGGLGTAALVGAGGQRVRALYRAPAQARRAARLLGLYAAISVVVGVVLVSLAHGGWTPVLVVTTLGTLALGALALLVGRRSGQPPSQMSS